MPDYHDDEIEDEDIDDDEEEGPSRITLGPSMIPNSKPRSRLSAKPVSRATASPAPKKKIRSNTPRQSSVVADDKPAKQVQVCPICQKELETDNSGLNAHIDFCLSKGAIMQATAPTGSPVKDRTGRTRQVLKKPSSAKRT